MQPATKAALLWGVIAALLFGVSSQGYRLIVGDGVGLLATLLLMGVVGVVAGTLSYGVDARL